VLSGTRLIVVALAWLPALAGDRVLVVWGIAVAGATDVLDGIVARRSDTASRFGSQLDSIADLILMASTLAWLLILRPEFFRERLLLLVLWAAYGLFTLAVGWVHLRRIGDLHLFSAKTAGAAAYAFAIYLLLRETYHPLVFHVVYAACALATTEALLVFLTQSDPGPPPTLRSILPSLVARRRRAPGHRPDATDG
jgi:CDP-diacylglycerol--glycerol-3-phosphate 3-phosphatidyltransferase